MTWPDCMSSEHSVPQPASSAAATMSASQMGNPWRTASRSAASCVSAVIVTTDGHRILIAPSALATSCHDILSVRCATDASSFRTWTLTMPHCSTIPRTVVAT